MLRRYLSPPVLVVALVLAILAVPSQLAAVQIEASEEGSEIEVFHVTFGPGPLYWELFGHNAIWIRDPARGLDVMFNYGMFDFDQESFLLRFIQGRMLYSVEAQNPPRALQSYSSQNRTIWIQELNLTPPQRVALRDFLIWNVQPENKQYRYHYYLDNCSTRIRDAIDDVIGGRLREQTQGVENGETFRSMTRRLTSYNVAYYTGLLIGLAQPVDRPISAWEEMFIPMKVKDHIRDATVVDEDGNEVPLVKSEQLYFESTAPPPPDAPPRWLIWYLLVGLVVAAVFVLLGRSRSKLGRWGFAVAAGTWSLVVGLAGVTLALLWIATDHNTSYWNENLFYFSALALPLAVVLPPAVLGAKWAAKPAMWFSVAVTGSAVLGFLLQILPSFYQVNEQIIAVFMPPNLAITLVLLQQVRDSAARNHSALRV